MSFITENDFEQEIIKKVQSIGYKYLSQEQILKHRKSEAEVLLIDELENSLRIINKEATTENIRRAIQELRSLKGSDLVTANKEFQKYIFEGIKIRDEKENRTLTIKLFDNDDSSNNSYIITNQFWMKSRHPQYDKQLPDVVLYCNGIPIVVMELKGVSQNDNLEMAFSQMQNYQLYLPDLFVYNAFVILANPSSQKFGSITSSLPRFQYWRGPNFSDDTNVIWKDLLDKEKILDVIMNFTFFTSSKFPSKIISSYHQYYGVKYALGQVNSEMSRVDKNFSGKGGIFWHTQGSGKSFSMLFLTKNLSRIQKGTTFVIVTDRNDLDNQLYKTFINAEEYIGQKIHQVTTISDLKESLNNRKQDGVFFTTIQKFTSDIGELTDRKNILVISDEAHRSHNNVDGEWVYNSETQEIDEKNGSAKYLRDALPRATFIGFTGTPVENEDKSTTDIFGQVVTQYLMTHAERDGVIVPIRYESRKPVLELDSEETKKLIQQHNEIMEEIERMSMVPAEVEKKLNRILQQVKNIVSDPDRITGVARDFIAHYESRKNLIKGKTMFVAFNRHIAFKYYKEIIKQKPELEKITKLIITNSNGQQDDPELLELAGNSKYRKIMAEEFKNDNSNFKIAIVVDMWLTGFDVPSLDSIYIDKPIKMHNLMQTIARTNRVYSNKEDKKNKEFGLVVDYIGLWNKMVDALSFYSGRGIDEVKSQRDISKLKPVYIENVKKIYNDFGLRSIVNFDQISNDTDLRIKAMRDITNAIYKQRLAQNFISATKKVNSWLKEVVSLLTPSERSLFQLLWVSRSGIISNELGKINFGEKEIMLLNSLAKTVKFKETEVINSIEGDAILLSDILSFIDESNSEESKYLETSIKSSMLKTAINYAKKINFKRANDLNRKLNDLLSDYDKQYINIDELMKGIQSIANSISTLTENQITEMGFTQEELSFYNIVKSPVEDLPDFDREKIKQITIELLEIVNDNTKVNVTWKYNPAMVSSVRGELKKLLIKYNYPPESYEPAASEIVEQVIYQKNLGEENE